MMMPDLSSRGKVINQSLHQANIKNNIRKHKLKVLTPGESQGIDRFLLTRRMKKPTHRFSIFSQLIV